MHNSDVNLLKTKRIVVQHDRVPANPLKWMEWQARRGSFGLMMPLSLMEPLIAKEWVRRAKNNHHAGQKFDGIARTIAAELLKLDVDNTEHRHDVPYALFYI